MKNFKVALYRYLFMRATDALNKAQVKLDKARTRFVTAYYAD